MRVFFLCWSIHCTFFSVWLYQRQKNIHTIVWITLVFFWNFFVSLLTTLFSFLKWQTHVLIILRVQRVYIVLVSRFIVLFQSARPSSVKLFTLSLLYNIDNTFIYFFFFFSYWLHNSSRAFARLSWTFSLQPSPSNVLTLTPLNHGFSRLPFGRFPAALAADRFASSRYGVRTAVIVLSVHTVSRSPEFARRFLEFRSSTPSGRPGDDCAALIRDLE